MIGIVDYGMGNLLSVLNAFQYIGADAKICSHSEELQSYDRIVIPGVGAFKDCAQKLHETHFFEALNVEALQKKKPTLGICLGMQVMAKKSYEGGEYEGLGWFDGEVIKLPVSEHYSKVPNIGWEEIHYQTHHLFKNLPDRMDVYFVHSYYMKCQKESDVIATYDFGIPVTAAVLKNNIFATQFHPEKSQDYGLKILENFMTWNP